MRTASLITLAGFVALAACGSSPDPGDTGSPPGGSGTAPVRRTESNDGGRSAMGGGSGSGGASGSGGSPGSGGSAGTSGSTGSGGGGPVQAGHGSFPSTAPWYRDITSAPLDAESPKVMQGLATHGGFGGGGFKIDFSIEVLKADPAVSPQSFVTTGDFYDPDCDDVDVPVPPGGRLEGENNYACTGDGDCHLIVYQGTKLFEMWRANISGGTATSTPFDGGCLAVWDTTRDYWPTATPPSPFGRGDQCTSADAAGYPIAPLLFSADEVKAGTIDHAIRFILPNDRIRKGAYVHPATHSGAGKGTPSADYVPYGAHLRLKSSFDVGKLPNDGARAVARALQKYGMFLADGGNIALTAQSDTYTTAKWKGLLAASDLISMQATDFEMVDGGPRIPLTLDCTRTPF